MTLDMTPLDLKHATEMRRRRSISALYAAREREVLAAHSWHRRLLGLLVTLAALGGLVLAMAAGRGCGDVQDANDEVTVWGCER